MKGKRYDIRKLPYRGTRGAEWEGYWCIVDQDNGNRKVHGENFSTMEAARRYAEWMNSMEPSQETADGRAERKSK